MDDPMQPQPVVDDQGGMQQPVMTNWIMNILVIGELELQILSLCFLLSQMGKQRNQLR